MGNQARLFVNLCQQIAKGLHRFGFLLAVDFQRYFLVHGNAERQHAERAFAIYFFALVQDGNFAGKALAA